MSEDYPARLYAAVHDGNPGDVAFYRERCRGARAILELGCGDARVLAGLADLEGGPELVGVDIDAQLLERARARPGAGTLELIHADMRELGATSLAGRSFDRVLLPHGSLYCLLDPSALAIALAQAAAHLAPGGQLILDAWAADGFHAESEPDDIDPTWLERVKIIELDGEAWEVLERSSWDKSAQRIDATYLHVRVGSTEAVEGVLRQRYVLADQLKAALGEAGFSAVELLGGFDGREYGPDADLMVACAMIAV